jgi:acetyl CoA:N6-hydroxylysine acetyl transferase
MHEFRTVTYQPDNLPKVTIAIQDSDLNQADLLSLMVDELDALFSQHVELLAVEIECQDINVWHKVKQKLPIFTDRTLKRAAFYQSQFNWLKHKPSDRYPLLQVQTDSRYRHHPKRPPMPEGLVYQRYDAKSELTVSFRVFTLEKDLDNFTIWMNDPRVAEFWEQAWSREKLAEFAKQRLADPHIIPLIAEFNGQPFGYIEAYWVTEDRLSPYYPVENFDRGIHLLVGEESFRGPKYFDCWMRAISHYLFIDDARTQRIVLEPRHDNQRLFKRILPLGYDKCMEFNFPHKRSALLMLNRDRFFEEQW